MKGENVTLTSYYAHIQSFNFRSVLDTKISFVKKSVTYQVHHSFSSV